MSGGITPCRHLRPYAGPAPIFILIQSGDDDGKKERKEKIVSHSGHTREL